MLDRLVALFNSSLFHIERKGNLPTVMRWIVGFFGLLTLAGCVVLYLRASWDAPELGEAFLVWSGMIIAIGLVCLAAARYRHPPKQEDSCNDDRTQLNERDSEE